MPGYANPGFDTLALHAGASTRPGHRRARGADPPDHLVRVPRQRARGVAVQHGARRARLQRASPTRPTPCSRSASPRSKAASARSRPRAARRRCTWRSPRSPARARTSSPRARSTAARTTCSHYTLPRFGIETTLRRPARPRRLAERDPARTPSCCSARRSAIPGSTCSTFPRSRRSRTTAKLPLLVDSTFTTPWLLQALRPRRRPRLPLGDQVPVGGHGVVDRRRAGRRRHVRLGRLGTISRADRALRGLPRHGLPGGVPPSPRSCCARGARACATSARA